MVQRGAHCHRRGRGGHSFFFFFFRPSILIGEWFWTGSCQYTLPRRRRGLWNRGEGNIFCIHNDAHLILGLGCLHPLHPPDAPEGACFSVGEHPTRPCRLLPRPPPPGDDGPAHERADGDDVPISPSRRNGQLQEGDLFSVLDRAAPFRY